MRAHGALFTGRRNRGARSTPARSHHTRAASARPCLQTFGFMLFSTLVFLGISLLSTNKKAKLFQYITTSM